MIISASRRTDIPAFYAEWFMRRLREGFCLVPNPFNANQVSRVSLRPEEVDVLVFWTKDPAPLLPHLPELDRLGYRYYFQYTVNAYGRDLEPNLPPLPARVETFRRVSEHVGPERVIWRYDPIILANFTDPGFHRDGFGRLLDALAGYTRKVVISLVDFYQKTDRRLSQLEAAGWRFDKSGPEENPALRQLLAWMSRAAADRGLVIESCAEAFDLAELGIRPGRCIDDRLIEQLWGLHFHKKDPGQRAACGCVTSRDIGISDTCLHGCRYCYATRNPELAERRRLEHDPAGPGLLKGVKAPEEEEPGGDRQLTLFCSTPGCSCHPSRCGAGRAASRSKRMAAPAVPGMRERSPTGGAPSRSSGERPPSPAARRCSSTPTAMLSFRLASP
ncbi:MAG: DUF1848 domain-containing protein [Chitinophagales bacterium]